MLHINLINSGYALQYMPIKAPSACYEKIDYILLDLYVTSNVMETGAETLQRVIDIFTKLFFVFLKKKLIENIVLFLY